MLLLAGAAAGRELAVSAGPADPPDALFKEAFGAKPSARPRAIPLELEVDGRPTGLVSTLLPRGAAQPEVLPLAEPVLKALEGLLHEEAHARLAAAVNAEGYLPLQALRAVGLEPRYDPARLALGVGIPARLRKTSVSRVAGRSGLPEYGDVVVASRLSGFLNLRLAQDLRWAHSVGAGAERLPWRVGVDGAINAAGWVLEGKGDLTEGPQPGWSRGDMRLVRDLPSRAIRFVAGDVAAPGARFLSAPPLLGVSVARNFSLDPTRQVLPEEAVSFFLERPSRVEVFINGRLLQTLQLPSGPHDLNGLLLDAGSNEVELLITDDLGAQQRVTKRVGLASGQLARGVSEFAYSVGFPRLAAVPGREQDWSQPSLHLLHRRGLSARLTLGAALQATPDAQAASVESLWSTFLGSVSATAALSQQAGRVGQAGGVRYELQRGGGQRGLRSTFGVGGEYRSPAFSSPGALASPRPTYLLSAAYGQSLGAGFNARLHAELQVGAPGAARGYATALALSKSFRNGLTLMLDSSVRSMPERELDLRGRLNLVWAWSESQRSVNALTDVSRSGSPSSQVSVAQQLQLGSTRVNASAGAAQAGQWRRLSETLAIQGQRAEAEVSHQLTGMRGSYTQLDSTVQARAGVALVYAGGLFALSRPVNHSFAIVVPNAALENQWIGVNPNGHGYSGAVDWLGPAVLADLQPYTWSKVRVSAPGLPLGYSLGPDSHTLRPTYRSGTVVRVGEEGSVLLRGVLRDEKGEPLALTSGDVVRLAEALEAPTHFFTNRTGRFVLPALKPGSYLLRLNGIAQATRFVIPEGAVGVFELGQVAIATGAGPSKEEGKELVATEVRLGRTADAPVVGSVAPAVTAVAPSTLRGRLYGDRNANGLTDPEEPVFSNVRVGAAGVAAETDAEGHYELKGLKGPEVVLRVETPEALPFGMVPAERSVPLAASEVTADLLVPAARFPMAPSGPFTVALSEGRVRVIQLEKASFPLAAWVAGLPLSNAESGRLAGLAERVHEDAQMRLLVVARAQTQGKLRGAVKRALMGARALQRYLQATQLVPGKKLGLTVVEALPGFESPLGQIDLVLVRVEGAAQP